MGKEAAWWLHWLKKQSEKKVSWDADSQLNGKMFQTSNQQDYEILLTIPHTYHEVGWNSCSTMRKR